MYLCTRRKIWTSFSCLVLLKCYHVVFSQLKIPANLAQIAVSKMHCLYANAVVQPSVQHCPCYIAWKTKVHTWCRHYHLCINAPMWREKIWLQGIIDPPSYVPVVRISLCTLKNCYLKGIIVHQMSKMSKHGSSCTGVIAKKVTMPIPASKQLCNLAKGKNTAIFQENLNDQHYQPLRFND